MKSINKIIAGFVAVILTVLTFSTPVFAANGYNYVTANSSYRMPVPKAYNVVKTINNIGGFNDDKKQSFADPQDLFIDHYDNIYVVDTNNNRIVKFNSNFETVAVIYGNGTKLKKPEGIFVDDDGDMYIADTGNKRILHTDPEGNTVEEFTLPESATLDIGASFTPSKLIVSQTGFIYVIRGENIMKIDGTGNFRGNFGQTNIGYSLTEALMRMFASEQQQAFAAKRLASSFINLTLGDDGMIYATSMERVEGEIKKLNSVGNNVFRVYKRVGNSIQNPITTFIEQKLLKSVVAGNSFKFGEYFDDNGMYMEPIFSDICVDSDGIVTVLEQLNGHIYQYDQDGNMLVAFGGKGESKGTFTRASSLDVDSKGNIYVLDRVNANIQVFEPTEFITLVHNATTAYNDGKYQESAELWNKVLQIDENYDLAHMGIAKTYYKQEMYKEAMKEAELVADRDTYSVAFDEYKYVILRAYFAPIILIAVIIAVLIFIIIRLMMKYTKKAYWKFLEDKGKKMTIGGGLLYALNIILHPLDTLEGIRYNKKRINMWIPIIIYALAFAVRMFYLFFVHFPLASIEVININPGFEAVKLLIVPLTWIPASFAATSISGGECKMPEICFTSSLCLVPYIVIMFPLTFLSHIMSKSQRSWYGVFSVIAYIALFLVLFQAMQIMNNYSFGKTIGMMIVSAFMMLVIWLVALLVYVLSARTIQFIIGVIKEFKLNFL